MCLLFIVWRPQARHPLIVAANRDEFHQRPSLPAGPWAEAPNLICGRDLQGGGSWLGIAAPDRFCALTNFREPNHRMMGAPSRGALVSAFLRSEQEPRLALADWLERIDAYAGFNLLAADAKGLWLLSNRPQPHLQPLPPGLYGISNGTLADDWPKVRRGKARLASMLGTDSPPSVAALFELLADDSPALDEELPSTGLDPAWERLLSPAFIRHPHYGTRCSTLVLGERGSPLRLIERRFDPAGHITGESDWTFAAEGRAVQVQP